MILLKKIIAIVGFLTLFFSCSLSGNDSNKVVIERVITLLNYEHFSPRLINDTFSENVYNQFIKQLDYAKLFFTQEDLNTLEKYKFQLDDLLQNRDFSFPILSRYLMTKNIKVINELYQEYLSSPLEFNSDETIETDPKKRSHSVDLEGLKATWKKELRHRVLSQLLLKVSDKEKKKEAVDLKELEAKSREAVSKSINRLISNLEKDTEKEFINYYINAIASYYDPHTAYLPPRDKQSFDIEMSGRLEGIGAMLSEKEGFVTVVDIVPGSACYRQGDLKSGDKILKVAQGLADPEDIVGARVDEAVQLIRGKKGTEVRLTVQKIDGTVQVIPLIRDIVILEETWAKSAVIKGKDNKKYGYIYLPKFYHDFNDPRGRKSSEDVKKETEYLVSQGVDGIVIDFRNNAGGALNDAILLAGLFIKEGPVVQVKDSKNRIMIERDTDRTIVYDGPLAIMINEYSASASEIVAAALQDYNRAVIIGSKQSYGKGTVQNVSDLNERFGIRSATSLGALKYTMAKFYRINGGSTQYKGVESDLLLPSLLDFTDRGERENDFSLPWDEIEATKYTTFSKGLPLQQLAEKSGARIKANPAFKMINTQIERIREYNDKTTFSLNYQSAKANRDQFLAENSKFDSLTNYTTSLQVERRILETSGEGATSADGRDLTGQAEKQKKRDDWYQSLEKDIYLEETLNVLSDIK